MTYLDQDTIDLCSEALRQGRTLEELAGLLHVDTELLGRLLQLPQAQPAAKPVDDPNYLWASDALDAVL